MSDWERNYVKNLLVSYNNTTLSKEKDQVEKYKKEKKKKTKHKLKEKEKEKEKDNEKQKNKDKEKDKVKKNNQDFYDLNLSETNYLQGGFRGEQNSENHTKKINTPPRIEKEKTKKRRPSVKIYKKLNKIIHINPNWVIGYRTTLGSKKRYFISGLQMPGHIKIHVDAIKWLANNENKKTSNCLRGLKQGLDPYYHYQKKIHEQDENFYGFFKK
ncbi:myb-like protein x [Anaeramoeba flamelloides]|uniref:Myb-like protein x n=1 Tax=Anaeramoeba flamelloides TaxID=1746091 RepID=A0ABQ8XQS5_9EUKA|nr:myb-like protein x [Anaeramoeba flamelloides]